MKQKICNALTLLLAVLLSITLFSPKAFAANISTIQLPFRITAEGALPDPVEVYTVRLTSGDVSNPMPNTSFGGSYDLQVNGPGNAVFPPIEFKSVGVYIYTIEQIAGSNPNCRYDTRSYTVRISVTNAETGEYDVTMTLRGDGMSSKPDEAEFHNIYEQEEDNPPSPPGPEGPSNPTETDTPLNPIVPTGVVDHWVIYLAGSIFLLLVSGWIIRLLRHKEDD